MAEKLTLADQAWRDMEIAADAKGRLECAMLTLPGEKVRALVAERRRSSPSQVAPANPAQVTTLDADKIASWPALKKALWDVVTFEQLNDGHYINAYDLTDKLYFAITAAIGAGGQTEDESGEDVPEPMMALARQRAMRAIDNAQAVAWWHVGKWGNGTSCADESNIFCDAWETAIAENLPTEIAEAIVEAHNAALSQPHPTSEQAAKPTGSALPVAHPPHPADEREESKLVGETYYDKGKDAEYFEKLSDKDFAWEATKMAQDLADMNTRGLEDILPFVGVLSLAAGRIERLLDHPADERVVEEAYPLSVIEAAIRTKRIFDDGCDRGSAEDFILLERYGLMDRGICSDTFGQDSLEVGEDMWTFSAAGEALCAALSVTEGRKNG